MADLMDTSARYRALIQEVLRDVAALDPGDAEIESQLVFDTERDHYQIWYVGWKGQQRVRGCLVQADLKEGKIWLQHDGTEEGVADELVRRGVPKQDIVLAFHAPYRRSHTGFAVA